MLFTYGAGTLTWAKADISRLVATEMRFLKDIEGKAKMESFRNKKNEMNGKTVAKALTWK